MLCRFLLNRLVVGGVVMSLKLMFVVRQARLGLYYASLDSKCLESSVQLRHVYVVAIMLVTQRYDDGRDSVRIMTLNEWATLSTLPEHR